MYEHHNQPLAPRRLFYLRLIRSFGISLTVIFGSLVIGMLGYHLLEGMSWIDSLVNASMLLGGMGPVDALHTTSGKIFASFYALYSGIVFLVIAGLLVAPVLHRFLHHFHITMDESSSDEDK